MPLTLIGVALLIAAAALFVLLTPSPVGAELGRTERRSTRTLVAGQRARLHGHLAGATPLVAPLSRAPCVVYDLAFMKLEGRGKHARVVEAYRKRDWADGVCLVDAEGSVPLDLTETELHAAGSVTRGSSDSGLAAATQHAPPDVAAATLRVHERVVKPGDQVAVAGEVQTVAGRLVLGGPRSALAVEPLPAFERPRWVGPAAALLAAAGALGLLASFFR